MCVCVCVYVCVSLSLALASFLFSPLDSLSLVLSILSPLCLPAPALMLTTTRVFFLFFFFFFFFNFFLSFFLFVVFGAKLHTTHNTHAHSTCTAQHNTQHIHFMSLRTAALAAVPLSLALKCMFIAVTTLRAEGGGAHPHHRHHDDDASQIKVDSESGATSSFTFQHFNGSVVFGCCPPRENSTSEAVSYAGSFPTVGGCESACAADPTCQSYTWEDATAYGPVEFANLCYLRHDDTFVIVTDPDTSEHDGHFSGRKCPTGSSNKHATSSEYTPDWCSVTQHPTPEWFNRAKFGIYAHWVSQSVILVSQPANVDAATYMQRTCIHTHIHTCMHADITYMTYIHT